MPQVRERPKYKAMPHDGKIDRNIVSGSDGIGCNKYFAEYSSQRYTGGILGFWCTHGVCLGFHCIPEGEGRDDVFSALYTRWKVAPKYVIYDFACALGPYCMMREAEFFMDTHFLIDKFHSLGHKSCSAACFLSTYAAYDPQLAAVNSSAAEFGNSGLKRIRKSIRYMSQRHAIIYIHRFLCLWNRQRRLRLTKTSAGT
ncbi:hypothetical protein EXIGLDRAFT_612330 [Exidia glandulosa HHB12029]|uniref:Uncharacterized protein n=1 Tax=Exidia glandulosa HHB12029 TaxID=1314781 RepID=A0A166APH2_EXIGL|nr:hypothetical protein EXIGLDRAFT_612330 [Exidia glandulosa HHB12029]